MSRSDRKHAYFIDTAISWEEGFHKKQIKFIKLRLVVKHPPIPDNATLMISEHLQAPSKSLLDTLISITKTSDCSLIKNAERSVCLLEKHANYLSQLLAILPLNHLEYKIRQAAAVFICLFIRNRKSTLTIDEKIVVVNQIVECFERIQIDWWFRVHITQSCSQLLEKDRQRILKSHEQSFKKMLGEVQGQTLDKIQIDFVILFSLLLVKSSKEESRIQQLRGLSETLIILIKKIQNYLMENMQVDRIFEMKPIIARIDLLASLVNQCIKITKKDFSMVDNLGCSGSSPRRISLLCQIISNGMLSPANSQMNHLIWIQKADEIIVEQLNSLRIRFIDIMISALQEDVFKDQNPKDEVLCVFQDIAGDIVEGLESLFRGKMIHYQWGARLDELIEKELILLIQISKSTFCQSVIFNFRISLIRSIYKMLDFCQRDFEQFKEEPISFVNELFYIIDADSCKEQSPVFCSEEEQGIQLYTIKLLASKLFKLLISMDQRIVLQIGEEILGQICRKLSYNSHILELLLVINLIRDYVEPFQMLAIQISRTVLSLVQRKPPTIKTKNVYENIQYFLGLASLSSYLKIINKNWPEVLQDIIVLSTELISDLCCCEAHRILGEMLIQDIFSIYPGNQLLIQQMLTEMRKRVDSHTIQCSLTCNILDSIFFVIQHLIAQESALKAVNCQSLWVIDGILNSMCFCIETEVKKNNYDKMIINKSWNVVRLIGQNQAMSKDLMPTLERILGTCVDYLRNNRKLGFEEDYFLLMASFIQRFEKITGLVLALFRLIPNIFYGEYNGSFGHSFQVLQMLIYYGRDALGDHQNGIMKSIVEMSLHSMVSYQETNSCEGILLLHSLFLSEASVFINRKTWSFVLSQIKSVTKTSIIFKPRKQSLLALMSLCFLKAKSQWLEPCDINTFIQLCNRSLPEIQNIYCLKVLIISIFEILLKFDSKYFYPVYYEIGQIIGKVRAQYLEAKSDAKKNSNTSTEMQFTILTMVTVNRVTKLSFKEFMRSTLEKFFIRFRDCIDFSIYKDRMGSQEKMSCFSAKGKNSRELKCWSDVF